MAYKQTNSKGVTYYLHYAYVKLSGGREQRVYFFKRYTDPETKGIPCELPDDYEVRENPRNGFLTVIKKLKKYESHV